MLHYNGNTLGNHGGARQEANAKASREALSQYLIINESTAENCDMSVTAKNPQRARALYFLYCAGQQWGAKRGDTLRLCVIPNKPSVDTAHAWRHI